VSAPNDAGTPALAQRTAVVSGSAPNDAGTPAPAGRTAQVHVKAPGPRSAQPGSPKMVPACRGNLQEKDRQVTVVEPPGQSEIESLARGQEKV
jgi:hypothetical protein